MRCPPLYSPSSSAPGCCVDLLSGNTQCAPYGAAFSMVDSEEFDVSNGAVALAVVYVTQVNTPRTLPTSSLDLQPSSRNPKPETRNPKSETQRPKFEIRNPEPGKFSHGHLGDLQSIEKDRDGVLGATDERCVCTGIGAIPSD